MMKRGFVLLMLVLAMFIVGCAKEPTGETVEVPETPIGIEGIIKETLPTVPTSVVEEKYLAKINVNEGELVKLDLEATDPDGDPLTYTFSKPLNEKGEWQTKYGDAGQYPVDVTVSDGKLSSTKKLLIIVNKVNRAPKIIAPSGAIRVVEGQSVVLGLKATDPDGDKLTWSYGEPFSSDGTWKTKFGERGTYNVKVSVTDGVASDSITLNVEVLPGDRPPVLKVPTEITVKEGETVVIEANVSDPDGDQVSVTFSGWMTSDTKKTGYDDAGEYKVTVTVSDGLMEESQVVKVIVENVNRAPEIKGVIVK